MLVSVCCIESPVPLLAPVIPVTGFTVHVKVTPGALDDNAMLVWLPLHMEDMAGVAVAAGIGLTVME